MATAKRPPGDDPHVEFENIGKSYDGRVMAVQGFNLTVRRGEFLSLLGPSGSGKTTCLMMLAGFEVPTTGAIRISGRSVHALPPRKRGIGMVFQDYALFPHMTVAENLAFPLDVRGMTRDESRERVQRTLRLVRLEGFEGRRPDQLSGGQQQRVAIARALVFEPDLVLMDEPLGALDRHLREEMQYEIRRIHQTLGVTIVYVTHDQQKAMVMSDRVAVLRDGRIEQVAPPESLYEEPERSFVARFIGENNRLHGRVLSIQKNICQVQVGEHVVRAIRVAPCKPGDATTLSIRPERVAVEPRPGLYSNEFEARIQDITFVGDHLRIRMEACGREDFVAKIPNMVGHGAVLEGDLVRIGWTPTDCRVLDDWDGMSVPEEAVFESAARELVNARQERVIGRIARRVNRVQGGLRSVLVVSARRLGDAAGDSWRDTMVEINTAWEEVETWHALRTAGERFTTRHYLAAVDLTRLPDGSVVRQAPDRRIYVPLFVRTLAVSLGVTLLCLMPGYPLAHLIAHSPPRRSGILLALVLVPFWTSLLVRTTSWIVLLQNQGVINDLLVAAGFIADDARLALIYNMTGTFVAMTHVLLPFMVLPLYAVMRTIPRSHMSAAASLGAGAVQAFRRVCWPQSLPGVGAGCLLVFILTIGYYITPALVGGSTGQLISNMVAYHMQTSLNWGLASALGGVILVCVTGLYILYDRIAGSERLGVT